MKLKGTSLFLGLCVAILAVAASPAFARSTTAFSSFHVERQYPNQYANPENCLSESYGAVVNNCSYPVSLEFDLPIDTAAGEKIINVQNGWFGTNPEETFNCYSYALTGTGGSATDGTKVTFTSPKEDLYTVVSVTSGASIQVICWDVPPQGGVANFNWNP